jgi:signal transduction histidine kinase
MTIFQKGLLLVGIPLAAQLLFLGVLGAIRGQQQAAQHWALHTSEVIAQAEACHRAVAEAQGQLRGLVLIGLPSFAGAYESARRAIPGQFERLRGLVEDNSPQTEKVKAMTALALEVAARMDETARLVKEGRRADADRRVRSQEGDREMGRLRRLTDEFLEGERRLGEQRLEDLARSMRLGGGVLFAGGLLAFASSGALLAAFSRGVSRRLRVLTDNTRRLAEGKELAPPLGGADELARLDELFHRMAETIRQKEQENELFVYSVSHDLRSPLVNLQGFSQELALALGEMRSLLAGCDLPAAARDRAARLLDRDAGEAIHFIQTAVTRLAGIIDSLLRLSRVGRVEYRWQQIDVAASVARVVGSLHDSLGRRGAQVAVGELPPCWGDPAAIDQVFGNLLGNAVNYLDPARPGRVEVGSAGEEPGAEAPAGVHRGDMRVYYVRDNGLGIPEAFRDKVFVAFQRLHPEVAPGEGIGLALVRRVVERHGGKVWLESAPGQGSTFYVALPSPPPEKGGNP